MSKARSDWGNDLGRGGGDRGQSELLGIVLVLGIVILGTSLVVFYGTSAATQSKDTADIQNAENAMSELDAKVSRVSVGESDSQRVNVGIRSGSGSDRGNVFVDDEAGWMRVQNDSLNGGTTVLLNVTLGKVTYEKGRTSVAYQGGGVWKKQGENSTMVSPPEFHYRGSTLTLPLVRLDRGPGGIGTGPLTFSKNGSEKVYPNASNSSRLNPLNSGIVSVTVKSEYYEAWAYFFETRTEGTATVDHANNTATLVLTIPETRPSVASAVAGTSSSGALRLEGSGASPAITDSYNSSVAPYSPSSRLTNGNITMAGDIRIGGNSKVWGDAVSGGEIEQSGSGSLTGVAYYTTSSDFNPKRQINGVPATDPIDSVVNGRIKSLKTTNNNMDPGVNISSGRIDFNAAGVATLEDGNYYLEKIETDKKLILKPNGGIIRIAVEDYIKLDEPANVSVVGPGEVRFYVGGNNTTSQKHNPTFNCGGGPGGCNEEVHLFVDKDAQTDVGPDDNASQLWVYGKSDFNTTVLGTGSKIARFDGVVYAPTGKGGSGSAWVKQGNVTGAIVTGNAGVGTNSGIHYDQILSDRQPVPKSDNVLTVTYLHVSVNRVNVTG